MRWNRLASWPALPSAARSVLFLNYDVALSQTVSDPGAVALVDGAAQALRSLADVSPVVVISGRDLADLRDRVDIPGIWYAGSHGFELVGPDGSHREHEAGAAAVPVLAGAADELRNILEQIPGVRVVHTRFAVAVHYREVASEHIGEIVGTTRRLGKRNKLRVTNGRMLVELRPDVDWDEGTRLAWIRSHIDESKSLVPIYIGGDLTDEDAFEAVQLGGIGIAVRHDDDGDRRTAARFVLDSLDEVRKMLKLGFAVAGQRGTGSLPRLGISPSRVTTPPMRNCARRCARSEMATSPPEAPHQNRKRGRCTIRAPMPLGCTTV